MVTMAPEHVGVMPSTQELSAISVATTGCTVRTVPLVRRLRPSGCLDSITQLIAEKLVSSRICNSVRFLLFI